MLCVIPVIAGVVCLLFPRKFQALTKWLAEIIVIAVALGAIVIFFVDKGEAGAICQLFYSDNLARVMCMASSVMAFLIFTYSLSKPFDGIRSVSFNANFLFTVGLANATFFCNNFMFLAILWGALGITLFLLINACQTDEASAAAKKSLIIIGGTDSLLILGLGLLWLARGGQENIFSFPMMGSPVATAGGAAILAFLCLLSAVLAKAGALPFHTWVPDTAKAVPAPVTAFLPAALDKILGIYFLLRLVQNIFIPSKAMQTVLLAIGAITILAAVFMALIQHNLKRLLGYHAVSQVGYMILGIATLTPIGILGGLFHLINNVIYKSLLFLGAGSVESRTGTSDLDELGGLGRKMPVTFLCMIIAALAISGVPPLNGFFSKWLVYQGTIELGPKGIGWIIWLTAAVFGSALTLASFVKVLYAVFLARPKESKHAWQHVKESSLVMLVPMLVLSVFCILFGVFAWALPVKSILAGAVNVNVEQFEYMNPGLITLFLIIALVFGAVVFWISKLQVRRDAPHIGGEKYYEEMKMSGTDFYKTVTDIPVLKTLYKLAEKKWFDVYDVGIRITNYITGLLRAAHQGYLFVYLTWVIAALIIVIWLFT